MPLEVDEDDFATARSFVIGIAVGVMFWLGFAAGYFTGHPH